MRTLTLLLVSTLATTQAAAAVVPFGMSYDDWTIDLPKATHTRPDKYRHRFATKAWTVDVVPWPTSSVFIQSLDDELASMRRRDPDLVVLHSDARAASDWSLVVEMKGAIHSVVLRPGRTDNAMCTFELARRADRAKPLAACESIRPKP